MEHSPRGRAIEPLTGDASPIISRGNAITDLGERMITSAALLKTIADGASGQKGLAVDKLQEVVGDCYEELDLAGQRYKPTGPVLVTYGHALSDLQPKISSAVSNCETDWETYLSQRGAASSAKPGFRLPDLTEPSDEVKQARQDADDDYADAQGAADAAYEAWKTEAEAFDTHYDTWEDAFDKAAGDIGDATDGGISDSKWDDLDGFVAGALEVLKWVGLALAVLAIIIGGPFIAALAAIVAIATLLLTIYSFARGNSSGVDLAFAIIGVIPFGSMGKLFSGNKMGFLDDMAGGLGSTAGRADIVADLGSLRGGFMAGFGQSGNVASRLASGLANGVGDWAVHNGSGVNIISRLFTGQNMDFFGDPDIGGARILYAVWHDGMYGNLYGITDTIAGATNTLWHSPAPAP